MRVKDALIRMAERLFLATIVASIGRIVAGGDITLIVVVVMVVAVALVTALLCVARHMEKEEQNDEQ